MGCSAHAVTCSKPSPYRPPCNGGGSGVCWSKVIKHNCLLSRHPCNVQQRIISQVRAFESNCYFAVANMAGRDHVYRCGVICSINMVPCEVFPPEN